MSLSNGLDLNRTQDIEQTLIRQVQQKVKSFCAPKNTQEFIFRNVSSKVGIQNSNELKAMVHQACQKYKIDGDILNPAHILKIEDQVYKEFMMKGKEAREQTRIEEMQSKPIPRSKTSMIIQAYK